MFGKRLQIGFGRRPERPAAPSHDPTALVVARRARALGTGWSQARSWFGGTPKLGALPWPRDGKGRPLHFLAQLDLSEIAAASGGGPVLPGEGALAFFVGGERAGGVVHVTRPGREPTVEPQDLGAVEDIGGDPFVDRGHRFGPSSFPFWPVEFRALPPVPRPAVDDDDGMEAARTAQAEAVAHLYKTRAYNFEPSHAAKAAGLGEVPLYWLAALMFAERVPRLRDALARARARGAGYIETSTARLAALDAGLPPPSGQGRFGDPAAERANAGNWIAIGRKAIADADAREADVSAFLATVAAAPMNADPYARIAAHDAQRLDLLFDAARSPELEDYARFVLPLSWRDYAGDAIKLMAAGSDETFARLPSAWRDVINADYRLPAGGAHLMFGLGDDIQGNEMFERPEMRMLLQLASDDMMYWPFGDNGVYQFWIPDEALRARAFERAVVTFECH